MIKLLISACSICLLLSCNENASKQEQVSVVDSSAEEHKPVHTTPDFGVDIKYKDWEIGDPENTRTALKFYEYWDKKQFDKLHELFADTVILRIPDLKDEIVIPNDKIRTVLGRNRDAYESSDNNIYSAVSLHDRESGEDWVNINTYSTWTIDGKRDSVLYNDSWKLKNGKLYFLLSYDKTPTTQFLKGVKSKK